MYAMERQQLIERELREVGRVSVVDLARRFDVTTETVRRDLDRLETTGSLRRVHGGAVSIDRASTAESTLTERRERHGDAKRAIAASAAALLGSDFRGSIFVDAGTTAAAVAASLPATLTVSAGVEVVTHSLEAAHLLAGEERLSLTTIGGRVRGVTAAAVGAHTVRAIGQLRPDIAFIGTNGLSATFGLSTPDPEEAAVKTAIIQSARRIVLLADAAKFGEELLVSFARLDEIDVLVTDTPPTGALSEALADADVEVRVA
ncbi:MULTISPECIES: DeoR/GlpR family DNA-binding transcription regulator [Microbacterium]|uniref:DeoR/GlpR family DNA-binding transcription regulator n=1 Tax=Microbacterium TaxID=33882 RepID=UPI0027830C4D|nr:MULTISPECIES: DeoR/GlpR family DNA-binding transcription regulator [Microbacterium]MDQ1076695.1 DeoR family fructose operon transcriptional repressor [Microbacterium sp. SORGH_AS_0969]MDQ1116931.1 DeoR family fructose operon transcriptional repressor [Microbacterium testaceum]